MLVSILTGMLVLVGMKILWNVLALSVTIAREKGSDVEGARGLSLMVVEPVFLLVAVVLAWWEYETPNVAIVSLLVGSAGIAGSYVAGYAVGSLLRKVRRRQ